MTWVPGRGFVQDKTAAAGRALRAVPGQVRAAPGQAAAAFYAGPGGRNAPQAPQAPNAQTGQSAQPGQPGQPQQQPQHSHGPQHPKTSSGGYVLTEEQQATVGKPWRPYAELTGMDMGFDRTQYKFNNIEAMTGGSSRQYTAKKRPEDKKWQEGIDRGEVDMSAPEQASLPAGPRRLAINRRAGFDLTNVRTGQMAGEEIGFARPAIGSQRAIEATSRDATPLTQPVGTALNAAPNAVASNTSVGKERRPAGMGGKGLSQARENLSNPVEGNTAASMYKRS